MMPEDGLDQIKDHGAVFLGAVGWPAKVPDHVSLWGLLIKIRRAFEQYASIRPVRLMPGTVIALTTSAAVSLTGITAIARFHRRRLADQAADHAPTPR